MSRAQWIIAGCGTLAAVNAARQALFATAAVAPWLAALSAGVALVSVAAFLLLRRRHPAAAPALIAFAVAVPLATVLGTEPLLADAVPLSGRLPGYFAAAALGVSAAWAGIRELARFRALRPSKPVDQLAAAPIFDPSSIQARRPADAKTPRTRDADS